MFDKKEACNLKDLPFVSVVVPVRNEEKFIGKCVESLLNGTYPKDKLEILVVDGMSEDETRKIVERYERKYPHVVKLLKNEKLYTPCGLNIGIKNSRGDIVMVA
ncbi:MAG TPA: glycosyltransferase, partial [Thermotoga sp.]|nr:glycosyltransferase [Thermotoga sp.]